MDPAQEFPRTERHRGRMLRRESRCVDYERVGAQYPGQFTRQSYHCTRRSETPRMMRVVNHNFDLRQVSAWRQQLGLMPVPLRAGLVEHENTGFVLLNGTL